LRYGSVRVNISTVPVGNFTGQTLKLRRPQTYRRIVDELALPNAQPDNIGHAYRVSPNTVRAIAKREQSTIEDKKKALAEMFGDIATEAGLRALKLAPKSANVVQAITTAGIATDKMLACLGENQNNVPVQVNVQVNAQALHERYAELLARVEASTRTETGTSTASKPTAQT
jgi:hypothetical protein